MKDSTDTPPVLFGALVNNRPDFDTGSPPHRSGERVSPSKPALALLGAAVLSLLWLFA